MINVQKQLRTTLSQTMVEDSKFIFYPFSDQILIFLSSNNIDVNQEKEKKIKKWITGLIFTSFSKFNYWREKYPNFLT